MSVCVALCVQVQSLQKLEEDAGSLQLELHAGSGKLLDGVVVVLGTESALVFYMSSKHA